MTPLCELERIHCMSEHGIMSRINLEVVDLFRVLAATDSDAIASGPEFIPDPYLRRT
jgi:hypothetical protein